MRHLGTFDDKSQPFVCAVCFSATTHMPVFALTNYGVNSQDKLTVTVRGVEVPLYLQLNDITITEGRPQGTGGLVRQSAKLDVTFVGPFAISPLTKQLYSAGANVDTVYFGIWVCDYATSTQDINKGAFFGYYKLDADVAWSEDSLQTSIQLIGILELQAGRYGEVMEAAETLLDGTEYASLLETPAYLGYRSKVKCVGRVNTTVDGYATIAKTAVSGVIAGVVQSATLSGTSINLGKSPTLAAIVGTTIKLKMGNGCVITGAVTNLGGDYYGINTTGMVLNDKWDSVTISQVGSIFAPPDSTLTIACDPNKIQLAASVAIDRVPSPTMYLRTPGAIEFYPDPTVTPGKVYARLNGLSEEATKRFNIDDFTWVDGSLVLHPRTLVNANYSSTQLISVFSGSDAHLNYATWKPAQVYDLVFANKTYLLSDILIEGMPWELIVTPYVNNTVSLYNDFYIKLLGGTTIATDPEGKYNLYYDNGQKVIQIPATDITSITYDCGDFGVPSLCKIRLRTKPTLIAEDYADGFIYADIGPTKYAGEVINYIFTQAGLGSLAGEHIATTNRYGNIMSLAIEKETWGELLDTVLYEAGCTIRWVYGKAVLEATTTTAKISTWSRGASTETYFKVQPTATIAYRDIIDNTVGFNIGRTYTNVDADGREFVRAHYEYSYVAAEYNGQQVRKFKSIKASKNNDREINYQFKHVVDRDTALCAIAQMSRIGHCANIPETTRAYMFSLGFDYTHLSALDVIQLTDFRHVSALNDPIPAYNAATTNPVYTYGANGLVYCKYTQTVPYMLTPGLCVVEEIIYNFGQGGVPIQIKLKQVQFGTSTNVRDVVEMVHIYDDEENTTQEPPATDENTAVTVVIPEMTCALGTFHVDITPGTPSFSTSVAEDACCSITTTESTIGDPKVTVYCGSWPDFCSPMTVGFYYVARTDNTIGSTDPLVFDIYASVSNVLGDEQVAYGVCDFSYEGQLLTPGCAALGMVGGGLIADPVQNASLVATVTVSPCIFNAPEGSYSKNIEVVFCINDCWSSCIIIDDVGDPPAPGFEVCFMTNREVTVNIPVSLQPVSDISI